VGAIDLTLKKMGGKRVFFDANLLIYFFNDREPYGELARKLIIAAQKRSFFAVTSNAVVAEVMVHPYRNGDPEVIAKFNQFFLQDFISVVGVPDELYNTASLFAGTRSMKLMDALHYATAKHHRCEVIISNDKKFENQLLDMDVINLDDLLADL
jgi:predicted nucleic acid-binding protein